MLTAAGLALLALIGLARALGPRAPGVQLWLGRRARAVIQAAGGGLVKLGQILATREDLCPAAFLSPLRALQDGAVARGWSDSLAELPAAVAAGLERRYRGLDQPAMSGSVAQVHAAEDRATGAPVAVKIVRQDARRAVCADMAVLGRLARASQRLPGLARWPLARSLRGLGRQVVLQFNMPREARIQAALGAALAGEAGVRTPRVLETPGRHALVMEFIAALQPVENLAPAARRTQLEAALRLLYRMIFAAEWLHLDLHPGNLRVDAAGRLVLLDFGLCVRLRAQARYALADFFLALISDDAQLAAQVVLQQGLWRGIVDREGLERDLSVLLAQASRSVVGGFNLAGFAHRLMALQARRGIVSTDGFVLPILALAVFEGRLKAELPGLDFQRAALPFVLTALAVCPDG